MKRYECFLGIVFLFLFINFAHAGVVWETDFDDLTDWQSGETLTGTEPGTIDNISDEGKSIYSITDGTFSSYRSARGQLQDNGEKTYQISSENAYGGSGKALNCYYEGIPNQAGGGLGIWLNENGYDEIYLRWRMRFDNDYRLATASGLGGLILKLFRIMSNVDNVQGDDYSDPMDMYKAPVSRPDWLDNCDILNADGQCGKQGYVILRWAGIVGTAGFDELAYNPEGRAGTVNDIYYDFDDNIRINWKDYHGKEITTGVLDTAFTSPTNDWVGNGEWVTYEVHAKHNTPGKTDGLFEIWLDGVLVGTVSNMETRTDIRTKFNYIIIPDNHYNSVFTDTTNVTSTDDHAEQIFTIDDIVISTEYIGPDYVIGNEAQLVSPPTNVTVEKKID